MNSTITYFEQAELALAAYSSLTSGMTDAAYKLALIGDGNGMSSAQASAFAATWNVVTQYTDPTTGVSATVFQAAAGGPKYLAIRGTGGLDDIGADIDLAVGLPMELNLQYIALKAQVETWLGNGTLAPGFTVSGHSLGGYLAIGLEADFGTNIGQAYLYNAPGINGLAGGVTAWILGFFGITAPVDSSKIFNIKADAGTSPITGLGAQVAPAVTIYIEDQFFSDVSNPPGSYNHSQRVLTDSLALYAAYARADSTVSVASITNIIKASSNLNGNTLELALDNLRELFLGATIPGTVPEGRESYYANLYQLTDWLDVRNQGGTPALKLDALTSYGGTTIASKAQAATPDGLAYRYAVTQLNPFALTGDASIYASHNANGELDIYDPATGHGTFTDQYLKDRAKMLSWKIKYDMGAEDADDDLLGVLERADKPYVEDWDSWGISGDWDFLDQASGIKLSIDGVDLTTFANHQIVFGSSNADTLTGDSLSDNLYGMTGADTLTGKAGNDYLEGGAGFDTYVLNAGDGTDTLLDTDGSGTIVFNGLTLTGGALVAGTTNVWKDSVNGITYTLKGAGASQVLLISQDGSSDGLRVQGWQPGQLGLTMAGPVAPPATSPLTGADGYSDALTGSGSADRMLGLSGNDALDGSAGDDIIEGGLGDDLLGGGAGSDLIYGGAGKDMILSATGLNAPPRDANHDGDYEDWAAPAGAGAVWTQGRTWGVYASVDASGDIYVVDGGGSTSQDSAGDVVFAGDDDDRVVGGLGDDYLDGGLGNDMLTGHGGNDVIDSGDGEDYIRGDGIVLPGYYETLAETQHGNDVLDGGAGNDQLIGGGRDDGLFGGIGNDKLWGDDATEAKLGGQYHGSDYLDGGADDDQLIGGGQDDYLFGRDGADKLWGDTDDEADLAGQYHGNDTLDGGDGDDQLVGGGGSDILVGGAGRDLLWGDARDTPLTAQFHGDDVLYGDAGDDQLVGGGGADSLYGGADNDALWGGSGTDNLDGDQGNDYLDGETEADIMAGGAGDDTYVVDDLNDVVIEAAGEGNDTISSSANINLPDNVERLNLTGVDNIDATGNALDNSIIGNSGANRLAGGAGNDQLIGGAGADTLIGGTGDDYYEIDDAGDTITEALGEGSDFVRSMVSYTLDSQVEGLALNGMADLAATGNALANGLYGNQGNNTLAGMHGNDSLFGGAGNDVYVFNRGDGQDSIDNTDLLSATDTLCFGAGIADTDVLAFQYGTGMFLKIKGTSDQIGFVDYYGADVINGGLVSDHKIDRVEFANGMVWDQAMIQTMVDRAANNHAPVVNTVLPTLQARADSPFSYTVPLGTITDPDAWDSVTYSVKMPDGSAVPSWLAFDATSGTLSGTPGADNLGSLQLVLWGFDNYGAGVGQYVTLDVALNRAPILVSPLPDQVAIQDSVFSFRFTPSVFVDPDAGDALNFSAVLDDGSALPSWLSFDSATQTFSGTPTEPGTLRVRVTARDTGNLSTFDIFDISVMASNSVLNGTEGDDSLYALAGQAAAMYGFAGNDYLNGNSAGDLLFGGSGYDVLYGNGGNDTLDVGPDGGVAYGGTGDDLYLYNAGYGSINFTDSSGNDTLRFGVGIRVEDVQFQKQYSDLHIHLADGSQISLGSWFYSYSYVIERFEFADGTVLTADGVSRPLLVQDGTANNDTLTGTGLNDTLVGASGDDTLQGGIGDDALHGDEGHDLVYGGDGDDSLQGGEGDDRLFGESGNDELDGGVGDDYLAGGAGDDHYREAGAGQDRILDSAGMDTLHFASGIAPENLIVSRVDAHLRIGFSDREHSVTLQEWFRQPRNSIEYFAFSDGRQWSAADINSAFSTISGNGSVTGGAGNDLLYGGTGVDTLQGSAGDDLLDGGAGADSLAGGAGNDTYITDAADAIVELPGEGNDTLVWTSSTAVILQDGLENLVMAESAGGATITGNAGDNRIVGNNADNHLDGGAGADILEGGLGSDNYVVDSPGDQIIERFNEGSSDTAYASVTYAIGEHVECLTLTGSDVIDGYGNALNNSLTGNDAANRLVGGAGNDSFTGGLGADVLVGGSGDDYYRLDGYDDIVMEESNEGRDRIYINQVSAEKGNTSYVGTFTMAANVEGLDMSGYVSHASLYGNSLDNVIDARGSRVFDYQSGYVIWYYHAKVDITGGAGNDTLYAADGASILDGGSGDDVMYGGSGSNVYYVDSALDQAIERATSGSDSVHTSVSYTLGANLESLYLLGSADLDGIGNELSNGLYGNSGSNILAGGAGSDRLSGGGGNDTLIGGTGDDTYVMSAGAQIDEQADEGLDRVESGISYHLASNLEQLVLTGGDAINGTGNELDNLIQGNSANNRLEGGVGNDTLDGGVGNDAMLGGAGDDVYYLDSSKDVVTEFVAEGTDTISTSFAYTLGANFENLVLTGAARINGTGNSLDNVIVGNAASNTLTGGAGNDRLDGGAGVDKLVGGTGNDTYVVDSSSETVTERAGEGIDRVLSGVTHTLSRNVENLTLTGADAINGTGNTLANVIEGNGAANSLTGAAGDDTLDGMAGMDTLNGGTGNDICVMGRGYGTDTVIEKDTTSGNSDVARFLSGVAADQIWFQRVGNSLETSIIGTDDRLVIQDWYLGNAYHVEQFKTADEGRTLLDSNVQNLVNAMAAFAPPAAGQTSLPQNYQDALAGVIAANWQ